MKVWAKTDGPVSEGKYLVVRRDGTIPAWPHFVIAAADPSAPMALNAYAKNAEIRGLDPEYVESIRELAIDFGRYAETHRLKAEEGLHKGADPDQGPHRIDNPAVIEMMRGNGDLTDYGPLPIEAQGGETEKRKALATAIAKAMYGNDRPSEADYRAADAALAITHPDSSLESREARKPLKPWNTGDSAGLILALEHHMDQQDEAWPRGSASRSPLASVLDEAAEHIRALSSPPSLGMEGVRELQALSDAAMVGPWHSEPGAWISGPEHKGLIADCHPTFGGATDEHKATSKFIVATVNYVRQALASISTPSGEVG